MGCSYSQVGWSTFRGWHCTCSSLSPGLLYSTAPSPAAPRSAACTAETLTELCRDPREAPLHKPQPKCLITTGKTSPPAGTVVTPVCRAPTERGSRTEQFRAVRGSRLRAARLLVRPSVSRLAALPDAAPEEASRAVSGQDRGQVSSNPHVRAAAHHRRGLFMEKFPVEKYTFS